VYSVLDADNNWRVTFMAWTPEAGSSEAGSINSPAFRRSFTLPEFFAVLADYNNLVSRKCNVGFLLSTPLRPT
jgi:hypothetical protein